MIMKTKFYLPVIPVLFALSLISCKKEDHGRHGFDNIPPASIHLAVTVKAGDMYKLNLASYGNGTASITRQAGAYTTSQIVQDASGNKVYQYASSLNPKEGNTTDQVILKITSQYQNSGGCRNNDDSYSISEKNITIDFTVN
jgi:hypothetical protein